MDDGKFKIGIEYEDLLADIDEQIGTDDKLADFVMELDEQRGSWGFTAALYKKLLVQVKIGLEEEPEAFEGIEGLRRGVADAAEGKVKRLAWVTEGEDLDEEDDDEEDEDEDEDEDEEESTVDTGDSKPWWQR